MISRDYQKGWSETRGRPYLKYHIFFLVRFLFRCLGVMMVEGDAWFWDSVGSKREWLVV
jgi:hypothetical protein